MADQSISQLPVAATITGNELAVVVQNGITKQAQVSQLANAISPGKLINYLYFNGASNLIVVYTDSTTQNLGPIPGFIAATIAPNGHLILTNSTGGTTDAGSVFASLSQTFLTANNESATLPNSQQLIAGANITLTPGTNSLTISTSGAAGSLNGVGTGIIVKNTSNSVINRTLTSTAGILITNPDGISGNPIISPASKLADIQNLGTTSILAMVSGTTVVGRNILGTASQITVTGGDGSANPTISITPNPILPGNASVVLPTGTTAQRPGNLAGQLRFNTSLNVFEGQDSSGVWQTIALGGGVTSVGTGTGLTGGPITSTGTISIANTGVSAATYGSASTVPQIAVNAQGQITSASNITITPSSIGAISSVSGTANEITATTVGTAVTVSLPTALTFTGKTVTNGTFNMAAATVGSDTVTTNTATQTLTNKTISGSSNTLSNIGNSSLTNSSLTIGTTNIALGATSLTLGGLTTVTLTQNPANALDAATKQYVDAAVSNVNYHAACNYATTADLGTVLYNNGASGIGATITKLTPFATLAIDGGSPTVGQRILVKNETSGQYNGIYTVTSVGSGATGWVLTRATDYDQTGTGQNEIAPGDTTYIISGTVNNGTQWVQTTDLPITIGTTPLVFAQIAGPGAYTAGTGLSLTGTQFSIANTAVTANSYGSASSVPTFTVNAQGQLTAASNTSIAIAGSQITSGAVPVAYCGTGATSTTGSGANVLATSPTLVTPVLGTPTSVTLTNATGLPLTTGVTGTLAVTNGGTGVTSSTGSGSNVLNTSPTLVTPVLGTPTSVTLTNATGLPLSTGVTGTLGVANGGSGAATFTAGYLKASGTTAFTTVSSIPSSDITGLGTMASQNANSVAITGGSINGTTIGASTAAAITGTTITATTYVGISGGTF